MKRARLNRSTPGSHVRQNVGTRSGQPVALASNTEAFAPMAYNNTTMKPRHTEDARQNRPTFFGNEALTLEPNSRQADEVVATAQRLLSEAAQDLRSPLQAVREAVQMAKDGDLGLITEEQRKALQGATRSCSDMDALLDNMLRLEAVWNGTPRVRRQWVDAATMVESVSSSVMSAGTREDVSVVWDSPSSGHHLLYADSDKLEYLLLNLLRDAIRATPTGGRVMLWTQPVEKRGTIRFSVVDRGCGMQPNALRRLAVGGSSAYGAAGLRLAISRQMASLHFAKLAIASQPNAGTRVSFEVPSAGPSAVADSWCRWRDLFRSSRKRPPRRGIHEAGITGEWSDDAVEDQASYSDGCIVLTHEGAAPRHPDSLTALSLQVAGSTPMEVTNQIDERLQEGLRMYELAYRAAERRWVVLWDTDGPQAMDRIADTDRSIAASLPAVQLSWSNVIQLPVGARSTRASIRDLLVRDTLAGGSETPWGDDRRMAISKAVARPFTPDAGARRLDTELRRLTGRLGRQRTAMQEQAAAIRPPAAWK